LCQEYHIAMKQRKSDKGFALAEEFEKSREVERCSKHISCVNKLAYKFSEDMGECHQHNQGDDEL
jgi:hypothetical protein